LLYILSQYYVIVKTQHKLGVITLKFSVGYQLFSDDVFLDKIITAKNDISEVYFSWADFPNGRNNQLKQKDLNHIEAQQKQMTDLKKLADNGIGLNLLFNATCYGKDSQSRAFFEKIGDTIDFIIKSYGLSCVTTTSLLIAKFIKNNFSNIDVRASVNMSVGSIDAMEYIKDYFDSFYLKRELNRNFSEIRKLKSWCTDNGKQLYALANSGCLNNCSAHTFHDNLVSHEDEISKMDNAFSFEGVCKNFLKDKDNLYKIFEHTNFIRPEDVYLYEDLFTSMKLATRVSNNSIRIIDAYINKKYTGNTLDLLEPNHTNTVYPHILQNNKITPEISHKELKYKNIEESLIKLEEDILC